MYLGRLRDCVQILRQPSEEPEICRVLDLQWGLWGHDWPAPPIRWPTDGIAEMTDEQRRRRAWMMGVFWKLDKDAEQVGQRMRWLHCKVEHSRDYVRAWKHRRRS